MADWRGQGTMLVVDDEEGVRLIMKMILTEFGFSVLTAADGEEALKIFRASAGDIVAVILDLTMPHLDGVETFRELRKIRPDVRVVLTSGYDQEESIKRFAHEGLAGFIQKPFTVNGLMDIMRGVLKA